MKPITLLTHRWRGAQTAARSWATAACAALMLVAALGVAPAAYANTLVRVETNLGPIDIRLLDTQAPATVANFLGYARSGAWDGMFFHRSAPGFVVQGGGYAWDVNATGPRTVPTGPAVVNEFAADRSNLRGTVAMAKQAGNPNSATNQWFINLANNAANLDGQNGGFTVFGRVTAPGMGVADAMATLRRVNVGAPLDTLPIVGTLGTGNTVGRANLVLVTSVRELPNATDEDRVLNYVEALFPQLLAPRSQPTQMAAPAGVAAGPLPAPYRFYAATGAYVGVDAGQLVALVPSISGEVLRLGPIGAAVGLAAAAGY